MCNQELINRTLVAASIAKTSGFQATYEALIEIAAEMADASIVSKSPYSGPKSTKAYLASRPLTLL